MKTKILPSEFSTLNTICYLINFNWLHSKSLILFSLVLLLSSCIKERENVQNQQLKSLDPDQEYGTSYTCDTTCYSGAECIVSDNSPCTRIELDPCDYDNMIEYAEAIACELTKQINGCGPKNLPGNCDTLIFRKVCIKDILHTHDILDTVIADYNPFHYCSYSTSCELHICTDATSHDPIDQLHFPMSIAYQNALMNYARLIAILFKPTCLTGVPPTIYQIAFKVCKLVENPPFPCGEGSGFCYDTELSLEVTYICCEQEVE